MKDQVRSLNAKIEELSKSDGELQTLLKMEISNNLELMKKVSDAVDAKAKIECRYQNHIDDLRNELENNAQQLIQTKQNDFELEMSAEITEMKRKFEDERQHYEQEKQRLLDTVEAEKVKMRRLVKVLAEKEKREVAINNRSLDNGF